MVTTRTSATFAAPIIQARRWLDAAILPEGLDLLNVSQAAPTAPPPEPLRRVMADLALNDDSVHLYGPDLGLPALRAEIADQWSAHYKGTITPQQVAITSGCNQAFAATIMALCGEADEVLLPAPWYFNHKMWLEMCGVTALALATGDDMLPDPARAAAMITPRTRAIALVSPNNPAGVEYPAPLLRAFYDLARSRGIRLILDETYRDFDSRTGPVHDLFTDPDWDETLIDLYSFSKAYRLTGHRVGALIGAPALMDEAEKFIDSVTICPNQLGQHAALWGMRHLADWLAGERREILARRAAIETGFPVLADQGWKLRGLGAYFAFVEHPFDLPSDAVAHALIAKAGILLLPATMFGPADDRWTRTGLRIAFANLDVAGIGTLYERLAQVRM